jgi:formylglycine-generating enzyme required for sulfatase activity
MSLHRLQTDELPEREAYGRRPDADMVCIPGGTYRMGSDHHYPEEAPAHRVTVASFWMDRTPVTNQQFRKFVDETGHVTFAEIPPDPKDYPGALPHMILRARSFSRRQRIRSICATGVNGGPSSRARTGVIPTARRAISKGWTIIRSCMWRLPTRWPTPNGPARTCRPRPSGSLPRAADSLAPSSHGR